MIMDIETRYKPYYDRYDRAMESNDVKELAYMSQFTNEKDIRKWWRRQVCENMADYDRMKTFGYNEVVLNEHGWIETKFPNYEQQEFIKLGIQINRGCCNLKEAMAVGIMQVGNGKWVAEVGHDFSSIGTSVIYLGIYSSPMYDTRTEALNASLRKYIGYWHDHNKDVRKEDEAVRNARSLMVVQGDFFKQAPMPKGEAVQLSLFEF